MSTYDYEASKQARHRRKWIFLGSAIAVVILASIGVAVTILLLNNNKDSSKSSSSSTSSGKSSNPSVFTADPRLKKSFYGLAYTPEGSQVNEGCSATLEHVIKDVQLLSQLTTRVRLYGADCNQSALVLEAIKQTKSDIQVYLGNYVSATDLTAYERQRDIIKDALLTYGADHVAGITVGNEFMLNYVGTNKATSPNDAIANVGAQILLDNIADTRAMLATMNLGKNIPVGNSDAGSFFSELVMQSIDYGLSNVHPWFANTTDADGAAWTMKFFQETNVAPAALLPNNPKMYIAETGWPTKSSDISNANNGASLASVAGLQAFMDNFVCQANTQGIPYFFFELFDEGWKDRQFGGVEGWWGLFNEDRTLKDIVIPNCPSP